jgi:hypothetical protein
MERDVGFRFVFPLPTLPPLPPLPPLPLPPVRIFIIYLTAIVVGLVEFGRKQTQNWSKMRQTEFAGDGHHCASLTHFRRFEAQRKQCRNITLQIQISSGFNVPFLLVGK